MLGNTWEISSKGVFLKTKSRNLMDKVVYASIQAFCVQRYLLQYDHAPKLMEMFEDWRFTDERKGTRN
jgi:hypothetical protein